MQVRPEGARRVQRQLKHYSLPVIIAVGYRVRSHCGTQFRQWATARLDELIVKGFILDDERLRRAGGGNYFDELLARIRDIRSSEKVFRRKVLEIYATSIDYDARAEASQRFFKTVQNKMHWAAHGQTAAEVVAARADATKPNMGVSLADAKSAPKISRGACWASARSSLGSVKTTWKCRAESSRSVRAAIHFSWRSALEIYDAMAEAARTGTPYQTRLDPPPADPRVAHPESTRPAWAKKASS